MITVWLHDTLISTVMTEGVQDWIGPAYNYDGKKGLASNLF